MKPAESFMLGPQSPPGFAPAAWSELIAGTRAEALAAAWLDEFAALVPSTQRSFVLLRTDRDELKLIASRPLGVRLDDLAAPLAAVSTSLQAEVRQVEGGVVVTAALVWAGQVRGLAGVQLADAAHQAAASALLQWGCGWLVSLLVQRSNERDRAALVQAKRVMELVSATIAETDFDAAALAAAQQLAGTWRAPGVAIGWVRKQQTDVVARSNASDQDARANLLNQIAAAMNEALDLRTTVQWDVADGVTAGEVNLPEHRALAHDLRTRSVATALLYDRGVAVGAVLLELEAPLSADELDVLDTQCMMLAPLLVQRRAGDRSLWRHARDSAGDALRWLGDGSSPGWKLTGVTAALALAAAAIVPVPLRVTAPSVVEGEIQRAAVAPFSGYIRDALVRAGDTVKAGQVLATLDDKDLRLEQVRWQAELEMATRREREAMSAGNRVDLRLAAAQAAQASAQLSLAEEKLKRVQVTAPYDGVVVSGDLSQQLGSPVEQGKLLFELAPLDAWRVILKADERDVALLKPGQRGDLVLAGLSGVKHPFEVKRIAGVAVAEEGRNSFRVEAQLLQSGARLRPGMEGVAKVGAGRASALRVWTRRFTEWLRLAVWEWSP